MSSTDALLPLTILSKVGGFLDSWCHFISHKLGGEAGVVRSILGVLDHFDLALDQDREQLTVEQLLGPSGSQERIGGDGSSNLPRATSKKKFLS